MREFVAVRVEEGYHGRGGVRSGRLLELLVKDGWGFVRRGQCKKRAAAVVATRRMYGNSLGFLRRLADAAGSGGTVGRRRTMGHSGLQTRSEGADASLREVVGGRDDTVWTGGPLLVRWERRLGAWYEDWDVVFVVVNVVAGVSPDVSDV
jgi:hypothetical protein